MKKKNPYVYISVLNWNSYDRTIACIRSLERLDYENYEIIIVDNSSQDGSPEYIRNEFPLIKLIVAEENLGYAAGHRYTVDLAIAGGAEVVWLINTDITFNSGVLSALINAYLEYGNAIYGSMVVQDNDPRKIGLHLLKPFVRGEPEPKSIALNFGDTINETCNNNTIIKTASVSGCSMLIPISIVKTHGFMDNCFFLYAEERDYCYRLARSNVPSLIVTMSVVQHTIEGSIRGNNVPSFIVDYYQKRNDLVILWRYHGYKKCLRKIVNRKNIRIFVMYILNTLRILKYFGDDIEYYHIVQLIAIRDFLINRLGKTISPDKYI